ncbi:unnamed protein product [Prorocentrum cordatum]|uniref:Uncharacterized protein n=1 Tax=Prorocentrum cordatum TaxID=2364126 RepID=A0ABN9RVI5_9DINO|nr:unnamed protein product [Polarella glacialis]
MCRSVAPALERPGCALFGDSSDLTFALLAQSRQLRCSMTLSASTGAPPRRFQQISGRSTLRANCVLGKAPAARAATWSGARAWAGLSPFETAVEQESWGRQPVARPAPESSRCLAASPDKPARRRGARESFGPLLVVGVVRAPPPGMRRSGPISARPSRGSWPHRVFHRRRQWQGPRGGLAPFRRTP